MGLAMLFRRMGVATALVLGGASVFAQAPAQVYRCGNEYTNQPDPQRQCVPLRQAAVTVIEGTKVSSPAAVASAAVALASESRVSPGEQRARDAQARVVLGAELQRAQAQHQSLLREWNQGEPERRADEHRQPGKYQERVAQLRAALQRSEADLAGLQRELSRLSAQAPGGSP